MYTLRRFKDDRAGQQSDMDQAQQAMTPQQPQQVSHHRRGSGSGSGLRRLADSMFQLQNEMGMFPYGRRGGLLSLDPFALMDAMTREFMPAIQNMNRMVAIEWEENERDYTLHAEVPGLSKEDIKITLEPPTARGMGGLLTISGSKQQSMDNTPSTSSTPAEPQQASGSVGSTNTEGATSTDSSTQASSTQESGGQDGSAQSRVRRRQAISFTRTLTLPQDVDLEAQISATTKDGVLTLVLPKIDQTKVASNVKTITVS
jgi:HSP20 family molecular chaperone IbpA